MLAIDKGNSCRRRSASKPTMKKGKEKGHSMSKTSRGRSDGTGTSRGGDSSVERAIGSRLRAYYDEVAREPVPDRFVNLLKQLDDEAKKN
jgi:hypothetical protein